MLQPKYTIELIQFRTSMGPNIAKLNGYKKVVEWEKILPLLRNARSIAADLIEHVDRNFELGTPERDKAQAFIDTTAAIEEEKGVEG